MSRVRGVASRVRSGSSEKHRARALHVRVLLKDGRTVEGYIRREVLLDDNGLLLMSTVTRTFDSDMEEILTSPLDAAIARSRVVDIEEIIEEGPTPAAPPAAALAAEESQQASPEDEALQLRLLLRNGRTVEGLAERNALFDADGLVVLTRVIAAFDSEMKEVPANPLDAAVPRGQIVEIVEVAAAPAAVVITPDPESFATAPEPEPEPSVTEPEPEPEPSESEPEFRPVPIRTGVDEARDLPPALSARDDLAIGILRTSAAQTRVRGAHIGLALFGLVGLALAALLLTSALRNNGDQFVSAPGSPTPRQTSGQAPLGVAEEIAFLRDVSGVPQIHHLELGGGNPVRLAPSGAEQQRPDFSPDGRSVAYSAEVEGRQDIFVSDADGTRAINVTNNDADDYVPDFSPDGQSIVFASNLAGDFDIYILDLETNELRALVDNEAQETSPTWSPDGGTIAFASRQDGDFEIYKMRADGSESPVRITDNAVDDRAPEWSPDGSSLVFDRTLGGDTEIFVVTLGGEERQITNNGVEDRHPAWSPDGLGVFFGRQSLESRALYFKSLEPGALDVFVDETFGGYDPAVR